MRDVTKEELEYDRPVVNAKECIDYCLNCLYSDKDRDINDHVVPGLTFEEVIGALLVSRDLAEEQDREEER